MNIKDISTSLYNEIGSFNKSTTTETDRKTILDSIDKPIDFLVFNFQSFDKDYNEGLLLTLPEIWLDFSKEDWISLVKANSPRPQILQGDFRTLNMGNYMDLIFLNAYLKINPIDLSLNYLSNNKQDLLNILTYSKIYGIYFYPEEEKLIEDFTDFYDLNINDLSLYSDKIIKQGFPKRIESSHKFTLYVDECRQKI